MFLIFDVETSGFITPNYPFDHPNQARILQLGCLLLDSKFNEKGSYSTYVRIPPHVEIHEKAHEVNGITKEMCNDYGVPVELALVALDGFYARSKIQIAHNAKFDISMINHEEVNIFGGPRFIPCNVYCTMELMTPICKLTSQRGGYKWPKLEEAYSHLFPANGDSVHPLFHDALNDCRATAKIFKYLWSEGFIKDKDLIDEV